MDAGREFRYIDWLSGYRIELNTILAQIKPQAFWNWLQWKLQKGWPYRNGNRAIRLDTRDLATPTMHKFEKWLREKHLEPIIADKVKSFEDRLSKVHGFIEDVHAEKENMESTIIHRLQKNKTVHKIDLALEAIMREFGGEE